MNNSMLFKIATLIILLMQVTFGKKQELDVSKIKSVSIVYIDQGQKLESSFGHIALKLKLDSTHPLSEYSLEFVANTKATGGLTYYLKGTGIMKPYPITTVIKPFLDFKFEKTMLEDRALEIIELKLDQSQLDAFKSFLSDFLAQKNQGDYSFFTKNCSEIPLSMLENILDRDISWSNVPKKAASSIKNLPIVENVVRIKSVSKKREDLATRLFSEKLLGKHFLSNIKSSKFKDRLTSYFEVLHSFKNGLISKNTYHSFFIRFRNLEFANYRVNFNHIFSLENMDQKIILRKKHILVDRGENSNVSSEFEVKNSGEVYLKHKYRQKSDESIHNTIKITKMLLPKFFFDNEKSSISYEDYGQVAFYYKTNHQEFSINTNSFLHSHIYDSFHRASITSYLFFDFSVSTKKVDLLDKFKTKSFSLLNLDNRLGLGACYAFVELEKALLQRAVFLNSRPNNQSPKDLLKILEDLYNGNFAIFQGFKNSYELINFIGDKQFVQFLNEMQRKHLDRSFLEVISDATSYSLIRQDNINQLVNLTNLGIDISFYLEFDHKDKSIFDTKSYLAHNILVYKISKINNQRYKLFSFDPNLGNGVYYHLVYDKNKEAFIIKLAEKGLLLSLPKGVITPRIKKFDPHKLELSHSLNVLKNNNKIKPTNESKSFTLSQWFMFIQ